MSGFCVSRVFRGQSASGTTKAFTLVEVLIGATLSGMVMAAVLSSYVYLGKSFTRLTNQQTLESEARRTLATFAKDVQAASGLADTTNLSASRVALTVPTATSTNIVTYHYNSTAISGSTVSDNVTVNGSTVAMRREALTRCVYDGATVTSLVLLRNITDNDSSTTADLFIRYYDASNNAYTSYTDYLSGIRQVALEFSTQTGVSANGTRTLVYRVASSRLLLRNSALLQ